MFDNKLTYAEKMLLAKNLVELQQKFPVAHGPNLSGFATVHTVKRQSREQPSNLPTDE